jgi:hypothetical protein
MKSYTVHAPPEAEPAPEKFAFVKEGFSWPALFFPILWMLWHRLWLILLWYVVFVLVVAWIGRLTGDTNVIILGLLGGLLFAMEANNLRRMSLGRSGWSEIGGSTGASLAEAEVQFFSRWAGVTTDPMEKRDVIARAAYSPEARAYGADDPILGLFPEPER